MIGFAERGDMARFAKGDFIKAEFLDEETGESEWMWVIVESSDDDNGLVFGVLDSQPVIQTSRLSLGAKLAIAFDKVREHRKASEF